MEIFRNALGISNDVADAEKHKTARGDKVPDKVDYRAKWKWVIKSIIQTRNQRPLRRAQTDSIACVVSDAASTQFPNQQPRKRRATIDGVSTTILCCRIFAVSTPLSDIVNMPICFFLRR